MTETSGFGISRISTSKKAAQLSTFKKSLLYLPYYNKPCLEWLGAFSSFSAWATKLRRNVAALCTIWSAREMAGIKPQTFRNVSGVFKPAGAVHIDLGKLRPQILDLCALIMILNLDRKLAWWFVWFYLRFANLVSRAAISATLNCDFIICEIIPLLCSQCFHNFSCYINWFTVFLFYAIDFDISRRRRFVWCLKERDL